jgi:hypothetical protein
LSRKAAPMTAAVTMAETTVALVMVSSAQWGWRAGYHAALAPL